MITNERLKWLIENEIYIYACSGGEIYELQLSKHDYIDERDGKPLYSNYRCNADFYTYKLFEKREDAEFQRDYGKIERIDTLSFLNPCDINKSSSFQTYFVNPLGKIYRLIASFPNNFIGIHSVEQNKEAETLFFKSATIENYKLACEKAKSVFLGEKEC